MWKLKTNQPPFEMVDGPMAGRQFGHGIDYAEVPADQEHRFEPSGEALVDQIRPQDAATLTADGPQPVEPARTKGQKKDKETIDA